MNESDSGIRVMWYSSCSTKVAPWTETLRCVAHWGIRLLETQDTLTNHSWLFIYSTSSSTLLLPFLYLLTVPSFTFFYISLLYTPINGMCYRVVSCSCLMSRRQGFVGCEFLRCTIMGLARRDLLPLLGKRSLCLFCLNIEELNWLNSLQRDNELLPTDTLLKLI